MNTSSITPILANRNRTDDSIDVLAAEWAAELQFNDRRLVRLQNGSVILSYRRNGQVERVPVFECISGVLAC